MYEFMERLIDIAIPRERDSEGLIINLLMAREIIILVLKSKLFSQKLNSIM